MQRKHTGLLLFYGIAFILIISVVVLNTRSYVSLAIGEVTPTPVTRPNLSFEEYFQLGLEALNAGDHVAAIENFTAALALREDADLHLYRGFAYSLMENYDSALSDYLQVVELRGYDWTALNEIGFVYMQRGDYEQAQKYYDQSIYYNPRYPAVFQNLTDLYRILEKDTESEAMEWIADGLQRASFGQDVNAIESYNEAISVINSIEGGDLSPEQESAAYYNRALSYHNAESWDEAITDYTSALDIFPDMHDAYLGRGIAYRESEDLASAGDDFLRRIELLQLTEETTTPLSYGESVEVQMSFGAVFRVDFSGAEGDIIMIEADDFDQSGVDPLIVLLDNEGHALAGDDDFGVGMFQLDSEIADFALPYTGEYTILVSHANGGYDGLVRVGVDTFVAPGSF